MSDTDVPESPELVRQAALDLHLSAQATNVQADLMMARSELMEHVQKRQSAVATSAELVQAARNSLAQAQTALEPVERDLGLVLAELNHQPDDDGDETYLDTMPLDERVGLDAIRAGLERQLRKLRKAADRRNQVARQAAERLRSLEDQARYHDRELSEAQALLDQCDDPEQMFRLFDNLRHLMQVAPRTFFQVMNRDALNLLALTGPGTPSRQLVVSFIRQQLDITGVLHDLLVEGVLQDRVNQKRRVQQAELPTQRVDAPPDNLPAILQSSMPGSATTPGYGRPPQSLPNQVEGSAVFGGFA